MFTPGRLLPAWYSLVNDVALFLGDVMIQGHAVIRGVEIDIDAVVADRTAPEEDAFLHWMKQRRRGPGLRTDPGAGRIGCGSWHLLRKVGYD